MMGKMRIRGRAAPAQIGASPAGATQRAENARLPLARADLAARTGEVGRTRSFRREVPKALPAPRLLEHWVGEVISVKTTYGVFTARLHGRFGDGHRREERFPIEWVPAETRESLVPGSKFDFLVSDSSLSSASEGGVLVEIRLATVMGGDDPMVSSVGSEIHRSLPLSELVRALNDGVLTREIDEAIGWDPELVV